MQKSIKNQIKQLDNLHSSELEDILRPFISADERQDLGQVFTPWPIAELMAQWIAGVDKVLDPAAGVLIFTRALEAIGSVPEEVHAYDIDPGMIEIIDTIKPLLTTTRLNSYAEDFLLQRNANTYSGIVANPPYIKHHRLANKLKYQQIAERLTGTKFAATSNAYCWFLIICLARLADNGKMAFITPSEFLSANYGIAVKKHLLESRHWRYLILFDFKQQVFTDALTTGAISLFDKATEGDEQLRVCHVTDTECLPELQNMLAANSVKELPGMELRVCPYDELDPKQKWTSLFTANTFTDKNLVPFSDYAQAKRGIASGHNDFFTFNESKLKKHPIPKKHLIPCLTKAIQIKTAIVRDNDINQLQKDDQKSWFLYLDGTEVPGEDLQRYLEYGKSIGVDQRYLTKQKQPWWKSEFRQPAPILAAVFGRQGLKFIRNYSHARSLACFHNIYINNGQEQYIDLLMAFLLTPLAQELAASQQRHYGDGLHKVEPGDINQMLVIDFAKLEKPIRTKAEKYYREWEKAPREQAIQKLDLLFRQALA